jgi:hypothetical protein
LLETSSRYRAPVRSRNGDTRTHRDTRNAAEAAWSATAPALAGSARMRLAMRSQGRLAYPTRAERDLTSNLPSQPAAVMIYGPDGHCAALCLDLDAHTGLREGETTIAHQARHAANIARMDADFAALTALLDEAGCWWISDTSPTGGRHVYVPLRSRMPHDKARVLVRALAVRFGTLDPSPHNSATSGCIRTPGSPHKDGGHQLLDQSLDSAQRILALRTDDRAVRHLRTALRDEIKTLTTAVSATAADLAPQIVIDRGGRRRMSESMYAIALDGIYDQSRYASSSEARQAVITAAVNAGYTFPEVATLLEAGAWPGLAGLYRHKHRTTLGTDWRNAESFVAKNPARSTTPSPVRNLHTSANPHRGQADTAATHRDIRLWRAVLHDVEAQDFPGRSGLDQRVVLRALAEHAHKTATPLVEVGVRSIAIATGLSPRTVATVLRTLRHASDPWLEHVASARGTDADAYLLRIPERHHYRIEQLTWAKGLAHAVRPIFRALGVPAALVFEAIERGIGREDLAQATGLSRSSIHDALRNLSHWHLITDHPDGRLEAHASRLKTLAERFGVTARIAHQISTYRRERAVWVAYLTRHQYALSPGDVTDLDPADLAEHAAWMADAHQVDYERQLATNAA